MTLAYDKRMLDDKGITPPSSLTPKEARIIRLHFERIATLLERVEVNKSYKFALKLAARIIRNSKPD